METRDLAARTRRCPRRAARGPSRLSGPVARGAAPAGNPRRRGAPQAREPRLRQRDLGARGAEGRAAPGRHEPSLRRHREGVGGLFVREEYAQAIPLLERILADDPDNLDAALRLATAHSALGHEAQAIAVFEKAAQIAPDSPDVRTYLALHYARGTQWERAVPAARAGRRRDARSPAGARGARRRPGAAGADLRGASLCARRSTRCGRPRRWSSSDWASWR